MGISKKKTETAPRVSDEKKEPSTPKNRLQVIKEEIEKENNPPVEDFRSEDWVKRTSLDEPFQLCPIRGLVEWKKPIKEVLHDYFGSSFYSITFEGSYIPDGVSNITLDLAHVPTSLIVDFIHTLTEGFHYTFGHYTNMDFVREIHWKYKVDFNINLRKEQDRLLFSIGYYPVHYKKTIEFGDYEIYHLTKRELREQVSSWKKKNKDKIQDKLHGIDWRSPVVTNEQPKPKKPVIYVTYFPESKVIKVGRTTNWQSRESLYRKGAGRTPETNGLMRLAWFWEIPSQGDTIIDQYILYCAEDYLKNIAKSTMETVDGSEFFKGLEIEQFLNLVQTSFDGVSLATLLSVRPDHKLRTYASSATFNTPDLTDKLMALKYPDRVSDLPLDL